MRDKISKIKNLFRKYGVKQTIVKMCRYIQANFLAKISLRDRIYVYRYKERLRKSINRVLDREKYDRIVLWRSSFGWNVPLYQRPQHIFSNFANQRTLVFYEVTKFTDDVDRIKKICQNLYLVNHMNKAYSELLHEEIEKRDVPRYIEFYSTDWTMTAKEIEAFQRKGYQIVYEYIDDLNPNLAGTDQLPVNVKEKYEQMLRDPSIFVVVTADELWKDVEQKRGLSRLAFSGNGVDYHHFHEEIDENYQFEDAFKKLINCGKPLIGYYGALAKWVDYELIKKIADSGRYQVVLFGIPYDDSFEKSGIGDYPNVAYLGARDYSVLQNYAGKIDVLTIPFLLNDITRATSPVKLFEYMALNKPIVTTDMNECRKYKSVRIGHTHQEFIQQLDIAVRDAADSEYLKLLNEEALENTWSQKATDILKMLRENE